MNAVLKLVELPLLSVADLNTLQTLDARLPRVNANYLLDVMLPSMVRTYAAERHNGIFISYRRDDTATGQAATLYRTLVARYGRDKVYFDRDTEPGTDFKAKLYRELDSCSVLLAVIGQTWSTVKDAETGIRRLENQDDWVRVEIRTALWRHIRVFPILCHSGKMPKADELPSDLQLLLNQQSLEIREDRWDDDVDALVKILDPLMQSQNSADATDES